MGTSKASKGPVGNSKPIQDWNNDYIIDSNDSKNNDNNSTDEEANGELENVVEKTKWSDAKRSYAVFTKNPNKSNFKKFTSNYRNASGGSKKLSKSSIGGRKGAIILLDFLTTISKEGFNGALEKFKIGDISNLQTEGAINKIAELFTEIDGTDEGSAASSAVIETINKLYNDYSENPELIQNLNIEQISDYLEFYISTYIFERISVEVTKALESGKLTIAQVNDADSILKSFIEAEVNLNFSTTNFSTISIDKKNSIVNQIFNEAYSLI